ncbi:hypothetical protein [Streptomyces sp. NPDC017529]|uniref:hypothetical protein n=1 Tax=Streptomyces sp. NPDC017529 TaxID=3365000 RepID=UPI00378E41F1
MPEPIDTQAAMKLRDWANREREQAPALADVLDDFAANGLPTPAECTPWEQLRDAHYERLGIAAHTEGTS